jgi:putative hydrolase of the HAD superfamily
MIRAVLFDVGGPLDLEIAHEAAIDADIRAGLALNGFEVDEERWLAANRYAVETFAPNVYRAALWYLTEGDQEVCRRIYDWLETRSHDRDHFELRPGIADVLNKLARRGLRLGLVANQPSAVRDGLERHGLAHLFGSQGISGLYGFRKPDVRLFLCACEDLNVAPEECIMVGDRIDNDVVPARLLGMRTVLIRTGRHIAQEPRSCDELPDAEVWDAAGILDAIEQLIALP